MALLNLFKFLSPFIPQTKIESAKVNEQFSKIGDSMDTIAATLDRTPVYAAGTTFPSTANAGKAMVLDASGNPTFRAIGTAADLTATTSNTDSTPGRALRVKDFGIGIPEDKQNHIFSRFYRVEGLRPDMSGLGIGLYIVKEIIERHYGWLWVESEPDKGSTFWFTLPVNKD